ncbi:LysR family transcriptional regulator [Sedimentitalea sp. JM2-8]|uniref:LysR family transcriptional regulator n=1 Tax=Sedimentitalea xiamensis TaxID=3050037 RepID=A0ABT7FCS4_9RHOB|nr:LysR family transcriptional regulator [Sedimentitalea xiamensis]MDK3072916.1 LysR family transcriptional regulator [Sedimentitalea xiamensis]
MDAQEQNWDDYRLFLAIAQAGSLSGAARLLGVTHSTVFRRLGSFENRIGVRLFERLPSGYALTAAGEAMQPAAARIDDEIAAIRRQVTGQDQRPSGQVRITTTDMLAIGLLPPHLAAFRREWPGIDLELLVSDMRLDLTRREADVALRLGNPVQETLVGRRVGRLAFGVYASAARQRAGIAGDLARNDWIGFGSGHAPLRQALKDWLPGLRPQFRTNSISAAVAAARAGTGLAPLPCAIADPDPELVRVAPFPDDFRLDLWLLTHEDLRQTARIRAFVDFIAEALAAQADLLEGRRPRDGKPAGA